MKRIKISDYEILCLYQAYCYQDNFNTMASDLAIKFECDQDELVHNLSTVFDSVTQKFEKKIQEDKDFPCYLNLLWNEIDERSNIIGQEMSTAVVGEPEMVNGNHQSSAAMFVDPDESTNSATSIADLAKEILSRLLEIFSLTKCFNSSEQKPEMTLGIN